MRVGGRGCAPRVHPRSRGAAKYRLAIGNVIEFVAKGTVKDGARHISFNIGFTGRRLGLEDLRDVVLGRIDMLVRDFLQANLSAWRGQRLVLDEQGQPAEYSADALNCLLDVAGMEQAVYLAYLNALQIGETEAGRRGN